MTSYENFCEKTLVSSKVSFSPIQHYNNPLYVKQIAVDLYDRRTFQMVQQVIQLASYWQYSLDRKSEKAQASVRASLLSCLADFFRYKSSCTVLRIFRGSRCVKVNQPACLGGSEITISLREASLNVSLKGQFCVDFPIKYPGISCLCILKILSTQWV